MKYEVWGEHDPEEVTFFRLVNYGGKGVKLIVVNEEGHIIPGGELLFVTREGVYFPAGVEAQIEVAKDLNGCLKISNQNDLIVEPPHA